MIYAINTQKVVAAEALKYLAHETCKALDELPVSFYIHWDDPEADDGALDTWYEDEWDIDEDDEDDWTYVDLFALNP